MAASINTKKKNIAGDFLKRTAGLITGAAGDYISEAMPVTTSTISEAGSTMSTASSVLSNTMQSVMPNIRQLKIQSGLRGVFNWFMQSEDDLNGLGDFDESSLDFDIDLDSDASDIGMAQITESEMSANKVSKAVIESSHHMVEGQMELTANVITSMDKQTAVISTGFDKTNETLSKILEVVTKNTATLIETTVASNAKTEDANANLVSGDRFSLSEYKKVIQQNAKNNPEVGMFSAILPMLTSPDTMKMMLTPDNIVSMVFSGIMDKKAPKLKENMKALDAAVNETIMTSLIRLGENQSWGFGGKLSRIFGLDSSRKDFAPSRSSLELKQIPFDTITKEAIVNTIPGYLRKILEVISGQDLVYDNRTRKFRSQAEIESEFQQQSASTGNLYRATDQVRNAFGTDRFGQMIYDLMMTDLGNRTANGEQRKLTESFQQDPSKFVDHIVEKVLKQNGVEATEDERKRIERIGQNIASRGTNNIAMDISNQVARNNVNRNKRMESYIRNADQYEVDLSGMKTTASTDIRTILDANGRKVDTQSEGAEIKGASGESETYEGIYYTNKALFEIFRVLNRGINVFKVGEDSIRTTPYEERGEDFLPRPRNYKPKTANKNAGGGAPNPNELMSTISGSDEPNLLQNQELENGEMEDLTKGERFARWGKARGSNLMHAMFSGNPEQVREAFGLMIRDVTQVAGDEVKKGASKINQQFGNVSGYLRHKLFGTGYSYQEMDPETGEMVTREVADNEKGGAFGFVKDYIKDMFKGTKEKAKNWFQSVAGYFDYGDSGDKEEQGVAAKRKKFLSVSVGAMAGAGILGGPLGVIMGAVAGNALSAANIGDKIKNLLFGRETEGKNKGKATGLITRALDGIVDPIKFQIGKSVEHIGGILKKNILGPLSDIGLAIKDRITSAADSTFGKVFKFIGNMLMAPFKAVTKIAKLPITLIGNAIRGTSSVTGGVVGAGLSSIASSIAGKSQHTYKDENGEEHTVSTKEFLKQRRQERRKEVKEEQKNSQYRSYKEYKAAQNKRRAEWADRFKDYTGEHIKTPEEIEAEKAAKAAAEEAAKIKENSDKQVEQGAQIAGDLHGLAQEGLTEGSIFTHDKGLHDRLDEIISFVKEWRTGKKVTTSESVSAETVKPANTEISSTTPSVTAATEPVTPPEKRSTITEEPTDTKLSVPAVVPTSVATTVKPANTEAPKISVEATVSEKESIGASKFAPTIGITGKLQTMFGQLMDMFSGSKFRKPSVTGNVAAGSGNDDIEDAIAEGSRKEEKESFGDTLLSAGTSAATIGGLTSNDQRLVGQMVSEGAKDDSNKGVMVAKFKEILQGQAEKEAEDGEKKESIWEKLFNLLGNGGILGTLLKWGALLGGIISAINGIFNGQGSTIINNTVEGLDRLLNWIQKGDESGETNAALNAVTAPFDIQAEHWTDYINPFTTLKHVQRDGNNDNITNYNATNVRNQLMLENTKRTAFNSAFHTSLPMMGQRTSEAMATARLADQAKYQKQSEQMLDNAIKYENTDPAKSEKMLNQAAKLEAKANAKAEPTFMETHNTIRGIANVGSGLAVGQTFGWLGEKAITFAAEKLGVQEEAAQMAGRAGGAVITIKATSDALLDKGLAGKAKAALLKALDFIFTKLSANSKFKAAAGALEGLLGTIKTQVGKLGAKLTELLCKIFGEETGKTVAGAATAGIGFAVLGVAGAIQGGCTTDNLFGVPSGKADAWMKTIATALGAIFTAVPYVGLIEVVDIILKPLTGYGLRQTLAGMIYSAISPQNAENLQQLRAELAADTEAYNVQFGTNLDAATYNDMTNRGLLSQIGKGGNVLNEQGKVVFDEAGKVITKGGLGGIFVSNKAYAKDAEGNLRKDKNGHAIMQVDATGKKTTAQKRDQYGNLMFDENGNPIYEKKKVGDYIGGFFHDAGRWFTGGDTYETDENGNAIWDDETGGWKVKSHQENILKRAGAAIKDAGKNVGEWFGKVGSSIKGGLADAGNSIKKLFNMVKDGDVKALLKSEPDKGSDDDPTSGFGKGIYHVGKMFAVVPTAITGVGKTIGNFVGGIVNKIKNFGAIIAEERKIAEDAFNDKDSVGMTALFDVKDEDGNPASGFMKVVRIMSRLSIIPGKLIARVGKIIGDSVKKVISKVSNAFRVLGSNHETLRTTALSGNMEAYNAVDFQNDEENPVGGFVKGIFTVDKIIGYPTAALAWVGKKIADAFVAIKNKVVNSVSVISANHQTIHAAASAGDFEALNNFQFQNDPENPVGGFTEFLVGADRILHYPMTAMHWVGNKISSFVSGVAQKVTASVSVLSQNHQTLQAAANSGDFDALNSAEFENDPENPVGGVTQFLFGADKILHYPITAIHWVGNKVSDFITGIKDKVSHSFAVLADNHEKLSAASSSGDFEALNGAQFENDPENPVGGVTQFLFGADKLLHYIPTAIHWVGGKVASFIDGIKTKVSNSFSTLSSNHERLSKAANDGDLSAIHSMEMEQDPENPVGGITKFIFGADKLIHYIPGTIHWVGNKISEAWNKMTTKIASNRATLSSANDKVKQAAEKGDLAGVWNADATFQDGDPLKFIWKASFTITKLFSSVTAIFHTIGNAIGNVVDGVKNFFGNAINGFWNWLKGDSGSSGGPSIEDEKRFDNQNSSYGMGGPAEPDSLTSYATTTAQKTGGNPLNKQFNITSPYGPRWGTMHKGIDLVPSDGSGNAQISARYPGKVVGVKKNVPDSDTGHPYNGSNSAGNNVTIETDDGNMRIKMMHMKAGSIPSNIQTGAHVNVGDKIGDMGTTGHSTGRHLHYQLERKTASGTFEPYDPESDVKSQGGNPNSPLNYGTSSSETYTNDQSSVSTSSSDTTEASGPIATLVSKLKEMGMAFLNALTGGIFGNTSSGSSMTVTSDDGHVTISSDDSGTVTSGNYGDQDKNAAHVYKKLKTEKGLSDINIAGVLGNWTAESGIDPTGVETIYNENYTYGPKKQEAMKDPEHFFWNVMKPRYAKSNISIKTEAYKGSDGKYYPGIGIAGYTGPAATGLMSKAKSLGLNWYDLDANIAYATATDSSGYRPTFFKNWKDESSPDAAARYFSRYWEGNTSGIGMSKRVSSAERYYNMMKSGWPGAEGGPDDVDDIEMGRMGAPEIEGGNPLSKSAVVTSSFGPRPTMGGFHKGVDIIPQDGSKNADVKSQYGGTVLNVKRDVPDSDTGHPYKGTNSTGNAVSIKTDDGSIVKNYHLKAGSIPSNIKPGARVEPGQRIGGMGSTGHSTGEHLHYQIEKPTGDGGSPIAVNPVLHGATAAARNSLYSKTNDRVGGANINITMKTSMHNTSARSKKIEYIVIHYTAGTNSRTGQAAAVANMFATTSKASSDFIVDDGSIVQYNPDINRYYTWHCGGSKYNNKGAKLYGICTNANSIGIETCSTNKTGNMTSPNDGNWYFTQATLNNLKLLVKYLMQEYNIPSNHICRHYDTTGKLCPGIIGWNADSGSEAEWIAFLNSIGAAGSVSATVSGGTGGNTGSNGTFAKWIDIIKSVKRQIASAQKGYSYGGNSMTTEYNGHKCTMRTDCSGFVSHCLSHFTGKSLSYTSGTLDKTSDSVLEQAGFTSMTWPGWDAAQQGDILVKDGHTEIFCRNDGNTHYVWNCGSDASCNNPEATVAGSTGYKRLWRAPGAGSSFSDSGSSDGILSGLASTLGLSSTSNEDTSLFGQLRNTVSQVGNGFINVLTGGLINNGSASSTSSSTPSDSNSSVTYTSGDTGGTENTTYTATDKGGTLTGGSSTYPKYQLSDSMKINIAKMLAREMGGQDIIAARNNLSHLANLTEVQYKKPATEAGLDAVLRSGWYGPNPYSPGNNWSETAKNTGLQAIDEILIQGKRTLPRYVTEYDMFPLDAAKEGTWNTGTSGQDRSSYVPHQTQIKQNPTRFNSPATYTFFKFMGKNSTGDVMGYYPQYKSSYSSDTPWVGSGTGGPIFETDEDTPKATISEENFTDRQDKQTADKPGNVTLPTPTSVSETEAQFNKSNQETRIGGPDDVSDMDMSAIKIPDVVKPDPKIDIPKVSEGVGDPESSFRSTSNYKPAAPKTMPRIGAPDEAAGVTSATPTTTVQQTVVKMPTPKTTDIPIEPVVNKTDLSGVIALMTSVLSELTKISGNTYTSNNLLGEISEKDFVDRGLRNSIAAMGNVRKKNLGIQGSQSSARSVSNMAKP